MQLLDTVLFLYLCIFYITVIYKGLNFIFCVVMGLWIRRDNGKILLSLLALLTKFAISAQNMRFILYNYILFQAH